MNPHADAYLSILGFCLVSPSAHIAVINYPEKGRTEEYARDEMRGLLLYLAKKNDLLKDQVFRTSEGVGFKNGARIVVVTNPDDVPDDGEPFES